MTDEELIEKVGERVADEVEQVAGGRQSNCESAAQDIADLFRKRAAEVYATLVANLKAVEGERDEKEAALALAGLTLMKLDATNATLGDRAQAAEDRLRLAEKVIEKIAAGTVPASENGHYLAHRQCVKAARDFLRLAIRVKA